MPKKQSDNTIPATVAKSVKGIVSLTISVPQRGAKPKEIQASAVLSTAVGRTVRKKKLEKGEAVQVLFPAGIESTGRIVERQNVKS